MVIQIDTREKARAIKSIVAHFDRNGIGHISSKLYCGDYMNLDNPKIIVDRKQNLLEVTQNVCQQHKRFTDEIKRAKAVGIKLIFLVEHGYGIESLEDVKEWHNPRLSESPMAVSGERLYKIMATMQSHFGIEWVFCDKRNTGAKIVELLGCDSNGTK